MLKSQNVQNMVDLDIVVITNVLSSRAVRPLVDGELSPHHILFRSPSCPNMQSLIQPVEVSKVSGNHSRSVASITGVVAAVVSFTEEVCHDQLHDGLDHMSMLLDGRCIPKGQLCYFISKKQQCCYSDNGHREVSMSLHSHRGMWTCSPTSMEKIIENGRPTNEFSA